MKWAVVLGDGSDIGEALASRLGRAGWGVVGLRHDEPLDDVREWDLAVCCYGTTEPIGPVWSVDFDEWVRSFWVNLFAPVERIRQIYARAKPGASVCFFSGAGSSGPAPTYSAYSAAKVALIKMVELMDAESPDCKFFILGPGIVRTKILNQALRAGPRAANFGRVADFLESEAEGTSMDSIYEWLMACHEASKEAVGGRNFYVPSDDRDRLSELASDPDALKLRRFRDGDFRKS